MRLATNGFTLLTRLQPWRPLLLWTRVLLVRQLLGMSQGCSPARRRQRLPGDRECCREQICFHVIRCVHCTPDGMCEAARFPASCPMQASSCHCEDYCCTGAAARAPAFGEQAQGRGEAQHPQGLGARRTSHAMGEFADALTHALFFHRLPGHIKSNPPLLPTLETAFSCPLLHLHILTRRIWRPALAQAAAAAWVQLRKRQYSRMVTAGRLHRPIMQQR